MPDLLNGVVAPTETSINGLKFEKEEKTRRFYKADDPIPRSLAILFGFQQVMVCVSALLVVPFWVADLVCPGQDINIVRVRLISSTFVCSGINTIIQTTFGMRLALLQGTAFAYVPSVISFVNLDAFKCHANSTTYVPPEIYEEKLQIIQGCLIASSFIPMFIAATGLVGKLTKFIGPLTVSPLILLLMISTMPGTVDRVEKHWVAVVQAATLFATTLYLAEVRVPLPGLKNGKFYWYKVHIFGQYPYLIAIIISWLFCVFLTVTNLVPPNSEARTDKQQNIDAIVSAPWIRLPYPGQFGAPKFHTGLFFGFLVSAMASVIESVGDYHAIARISQERAPPSHAINRGIFSEGFGSFLSGLIGPGVGLTTHTENIGVIGITRVASRTTLVIAGLWLIALGLFTKVGAILSTIPDPLVGGVLASSMAMVSGVAIANVQSVDLKNSRNMGIIGFALVCGLVIPGYFARHPVHTGIEVLDQALAVLLKLEMFVGAFVACVLDNTVPGATREERGLRERGLAHDLGPSGRDIYLYPKSVMNFIEKFPLLQKLPMVPKVKYASNSSAQNFQDINEFNNP
uniref:Solute carrier family 23 member 1 n=1 Tax=Panagrolaimus sp. PS1159 TaxID=55785 RepID=A0AC35GFD0_9BILA